MEHIFTSREAAWSEDGSLLLLLLGGPFTPIFPQNPIHRLIQNFEFSWINRSELILLLHRISTPTRCTADWLVHF